MSKYICRVCERSVDTREEGILIYAKPHNRKILIQYEDCTAGFYSTYEKCPGSDDLVIENGPYRG